MFKCLEIVRRKVRESKYYKYGCGGASKAVRFWERAYIFSALEKVAKTASYLNSKTVH